MGKHEAVYLFKDGVVVEDTKIGLSSKPYITYGITSEQINNLSDIYLPDYAILTDLGCSCSFSQGLNNLEDHVTAFGYWAKSSSPTDKLEDGWSYNGINHADEDTPFTVITTAFSNGDYDLKGHIIKENAYQFVFKLEITSGGWTHKLKIAYPKLLWYYTIPEYNLIFASGEEGKITGAENGAYEHGTKITITAEPNEGYEFVYWLDDYNNTNPTREITVTGEAVYDAMFKKIKTNKVYIGYQKQPNYIYIGKKSDVKVYTGNNLVFGEGVK